jgi:glycosyltransferase involved in cell wall biosynthesis
VQFVVKAVESLLGQTMDKSKYEVIVVDNHSSDRTADVIREMTKKCKNVKYLYEENIGLSYARNTGWQNAKGKYIAFLDDDALASREWLIRIVDRFNRLDNNVGAVGGKVRPKWEVAPPTWLSTGLERALAIVNWSESAHILSERQWLAGVNIAYKKSILKELKGFNVSFGRRGKNLLSIEETIVRDQMEKRNVKSYYDPEIVVDHFIPKARLNKKWFWKRSFWQGVSEAKYSIMQERPTFFKRLKMYPSFLANSLKSGYLAREEGQIPKKNYLVGFNHSFFDVICFIGKNFGFIYGLLGKK